MKYTVDPIKGIAALRFCDRLDGYVAGIQAMAALAKDLRVREAAEAGGAVAVEVPSSGSVVSESKA